MLKEYYYFLDKKKKQKTLNMKVSSVSPLHMGPCFGFNTLNKNSSIVFSTRARVEKILGRALLGFSRKKSPVEDINGNFQMF